MFRIPLLNTSSVHFHKSIHLVNLIQNENLNFIKYLKTQVPVILLLN